MAVSIVVAASVLAIGLVVAAVVVTRDDEQSGTATPSSTASPSTSSPTTDPAGIAPSDSDRERAVAAAERVLDRALSRDYRTLDSDVRSALPFLTPEYAVEYRRVVESVREQAISRRVVVVPTLLGSGVSGGAEGRVDVVTFVDQRATFAGGQPSTTPSAVLSRMVLRGDRWLLDGLGLTGGGRTTDPDPEPDPERRAALAAATELATLFTTIDYRTADRTATRISEATTGEFREEYLDVVTRLFAEVRRVRSVADGEVRAVALETFAGDRATALVSVATTTRTASRPDPVSAERRLRIDLTLVDGVWLGSSLEYVE